MSSLILKTFCTTCEVGPFSERFIYVQWGFHYVLEVTDTTDIGHLQDPSDDFIRDTLFKRKGEVEKTLPDTLKIYSELGFMNVEHENLKRRYANDTTMSLMEPVGEIPREDFYVTEDNYAWDLSELVQAITANGGVMRNPLSREMFTPKDVRGILTSPHGKPLAPLQAAQHDMSQGVRPETIARMEKLAEVMLAEMERDQMASRKEIDEFQAYIATCKFFFFTSLIAGLYANN